MNQATFKVALDAECRDNAGFAHHWATIVTHADKLFALYDVPTSPAFKDAVKARAKTKHANANARAKNEAMRSVGLVRVKGALGGIYWE